MLPEQIADARSLAAAARHERRAGGDGERMLDRERRVVGDAGSVAERADHVVGLLARAPGPRAAGAELLVEAPDPHEQRPAEEEPGGRDEVPDVPGSQHGRLAAPARIAAPVGVLHGNRDAVELLAHAQLLRDVGEEGRRVTAVVVGERHDVRLDELERDIARAREPGRGGHSRELELASGQHRLDAPVGVLVDHDHAERPVGLPLERVQQPAQLVDASEGRDDEVERRRAPGHVP